MRPYRCEWCHRRFWERPPANPSLQKEKCEQSRGTGQLGKQTALVSVAVQKENREQTRGTGRRNSTSPQRTGRSWKGVLGGVVTAFLLVPVPVFATITFTGVTWTVSQPGSSALFTSVGQSSNATDTVLTFYLAGPNTTSFSSGKTTVTSSAITATSSDTLKATWASLTNLKVTGGSVTASISVTNTPSGTPAGNMFSATYTTTPSSDSPPTTNMTSFTADPVI